MDNNGGISSTWRFALVLSITCSLDSNISFTACSRYSKAKHTLFGCGEHGGLTACLLSVGSIQHRNHGMASLICNDVTSFICHTLSKVVGFAVHSSFLLQQRWTGLCSLNDSYIIK